MLKYHSITHGDGCSALCSGYPELAGEMKAPEGNN